MGMTDQESDGLARRFEDHRRYLQGVAYRMLGSRSEADDVVQEAWLRLARSDASAIEDLRRWLTIVVSRICLDHLRARRAQLEDYVGTWLPEPVVDNEMGDIADSVGLALLVVLETLNPAERLAFVLHDVFAVSFDEIGAVIGRSAVAARQLASRARRRVRKSAPPPDTDRTAQRRVVDAFLAAVRGGDFATLLEILDPDVVMRTDGGGTGPLARPPLVGARAVAERLATTGRRIAPSCVPVIVNAAAGLRVGPAHRPRAIINFTIVAGRITAIDIIGDRAKLAHIQTL